MAKHPNSPSACFHSLAKSNSRSQVIFPLSQAVLFIAVIAGKPLSMAALHRRFLQVTWKPSLPFRNSKANTNLAGETDTAGSASLRKSDLKFGSKRRKTAVLPVASLQHQPQPCPIHNPFLFCWWASYKCVAL